MPYKRFRRNNPYRRKRRRAPRRARKYRRGKRRLPITGFPRSKMVKLRYAETISLDVGAGGTTAVNDFVANGMFDPNSTGVGHQPKGFDQWMLMYNHFTVVGAKLTVKYVPDTATSGIASQVGIGLFDTTGQISAGVGLDAIAEMKQAGPRCVLMGDLDNNPSARGRPITISRSFSAKKFFGTKSIVGKDNYRGNVAANPTETAVFTVYAANSGGADAAAIRIQCIIDYIAVFTEPNQLAQS